MVKYIKILDINVTSEKKHKVLEYLLERLQKGTTKTFITTPNPEILVYARSHLSYRDKLNTADIALPDGVGLHLASKLMGKQLTDRITGVDFIEELCKACREKPLSMGFLGGRGGVAEKAAQCLKEKYPWIEVGFVGEVWSVADAGARRETPAPATRSVGKMIDILFVAYGFPKQEEWIYDNLPKLPVKAAMGVGGAFDYISGDVQRAPKAIRALGLEWLFRLFVQPWRIKRQVSLLIFLILLAKDLKK